MPRSVNADLSDLGVVGLAARQVHVMVDYPPKQRVVFTDQASGGEDDHHFGKLHYKGFEEQGKTAVRSGPRNSDAVDAATGTLDAGSAGVEIGLMLEEVEVAPSQGFRIVGLDGGGANGTRESGAAWKVEMNVETSRLDGKTATIHQPGWQEP